MLKNISQKFMPSFVSHRSQNSVKNAYKSIFTNSLVS